MNTRMSDSTPLSAAQYLDLLLGPQNSSSAFPNDQARRRAWQRSKAILEPLVDPGARPSAWWDYDAPEPSGPRETALEFLTRHGLLSEAERGAKSIHEPRETHNRRTEMREECWHARRTG
jgi:hypothetical protein